MNVPVGKGGCGSGQSCNPARDTTRKMDTQIWTFDDANTYWRQYDIQQYEIQHNESTLVYDHTQVKRPYMFGRLDEVEWRMEDGGVSHQHRHLRASRRGVQIARYKISVKRETKYQ